MALGDSNINSRNEIDACLDEYPGFRMGFSRVGEYKDFIVSAKPTTLEEIPNSPSMPIVRFSDHDPVVAMLVPAQSRTDQGQDLEIGGQETADAEPTDQDASHSAHLTPSDRRSETLIRNSSATAL